MRQAIKFLSDHLFFIKGSLIASMAFVTFFIDKNNPWHHWSWISYGILTVILVSAEYFEHKENSRTPLEKIKKYLTDIKGWVQGGSDKPSYYSAAPEFTIRTSSEEAHLDFTQEWTRGEIGSSYNTGNGAYYSDIYFYETRLKRIHIVIFDGGKKTIVAPDWAAIGAGRIYFYLEDGIEYAYQKYLSGIYGRDFSKGLQKSAASGEFDVPTFKDKSELEKFISICNIESADRPETNIDRQNSAFYELLEKYKIFRKKCNRGDTRIPVTQTQAKEAA